MRHEVIVVSHRSPKNLFLERRLFRLAAKTEVGNEAPLPPWIDAPSDDAGDVLRYLR